MGIELRILGQPQIALDGREVTDQIGAKPLALMAYLALARSARLPRAKLAATFWSEKTDEASRYRLRYALWDLRRTLGKGCVLSDDGACWLGSEEDVWVDAREFLRECQGLGVGDPHPSITALPRHSERPEGAKNPVLGNILPRKISLVRKLRNDGESLQQVADSVPLRQASDAIDAVSSLLSPYRGELLEGLAVRDAPLFEEWLLAERERLELLHQEALWQLANAQRSAGLLADAARTLEGLIAADPLRERCYRALMGLHARQGDSAAALRVYRQCALVVRAELGVAPSPATERLRQTIQGGARESSRAEVERAAALVRRGRGREAWAVCAAAEELATDAISASQIALMRAEIAVHLGEQTQVLTLIQEARRLIGGRLS